jgi:outer membrane autotransporter protein
VSGFSNEGTYALQPSAIAGANYTISGNYAQASGGILQVNVTSSGTAGDGTLSGNYGQLWVTGAATFDANSNINVLMTPDTAVSRGGTLTGVLRAGTLTSDGFTITDNSALINFNYSTSSGVLSLVAINAAACGATVSGTQAGPCEVAFDAPNLYVSPTGTISGGAQGVKVLSGLTTGEINNAGLISAITTGIQMAGATLTGGITNSGSIGGLAGIYLNASNLTGGLNNTGLVTGTNYSIYVDNNSTLSGGVTLAGSGSTFSGSLFNAGLIADGINVNSGALIASGLNNTGSITSGSVAGISIASASLNSGLTNTGAINGSVTGIQLASSNLMGGLGNTVKITGGNTGIKLASSNLTGGLNNSGIISGSLYSVYVDTASTLSGGIAITGTSATFVGDIYAPNVLLSLNTGSEFTNTNVMSVSGVLVSSGATFNLTNGVSSSSRMTGNINVGSGYVTNQGVVDVGARGGANTPTITGNFTQDASGTFRTTVVSDTAYGQLYVSGSATLAGTAQVSVSGVATALTQGGTLSGVISAGNALTGAFAEINTNSSIYRFTGAYTANSFDLLIAGTQQNAISNDVALYGSSAAAGAAVALDQIAINPGAMAPVIDTLDAKSGQAMANAVEQTLPALVGGSSQVSAQSQTAFNQVVQSRQTQIAGLSSGEGFAGNRDVWGKAFGSWANQSNLNNVAGYKVDSGGVAFGVDRQLSTRANIGFSLAYANSNVNSNSSVAPSSLQINSYQAGLYGDYALQPDLQLAYQLDGAINTNSSSRSLSAFAGTSGVGANAFGQYNSYVGHVGVGVKRLFSINPTTRITPELRVDYTVVETEGYTETRGGLLNLAMSSQTYQTLYTGANVRVDHTLKNGLNLSVNVGAAYNALNNQVQATSAYVGGGPSFVTNGLEVSPWLYNAGAGIGGMISKDVELNVRYNINFSPTNYTNQMVSANVKWLF